MCPYDPTDIFCARLRHRFKLTQAEHRLVENGSDHATPDVSLVRLLVRAHVISDRILADKSLTLDDVARSEDIFHSYATHLLRLTLLAPDIFSAILGGKHPLELTARKLLDDTRLPLNWSEQRRSLWVRVSNAKNEICATNSIPNQPVLFFKSVSLTRNSVTTSETPVPPNSCVETLTYLPREYADEIVSPQRAESTLRRIGPKNPGQYAFPP
jgi:hypothetical protein